MKMNVAAHQEKEKTGKREAEEESKQPTDFKEAACCPTALCSEGSTAKKWFV